MPNIGSRAGRALHALNMPPSGALAAVPQQERLATIRETGEIL
ncbi:hypothetical protein [Mesorhizobium sp.]|nr:hypothetical protein [Mesorhizobium sp.]